MKNFKLISPGGKTLPIWLQSHAGAVAYYQKNNDGKFYILITGRDAYNRSVIGRAEWDANDPSKLINIEPEPVLKLGPLGSFYDSGTSYPYVIQINGKLIMYFTGWKKGVSVPFYNEIGMAKFNAHTNSFDVISHAPILSKSNDEFLGFGSMQVYLEGGCYHMIYASYDSWVSDKGVEYHKYNLRKRTSVDGLNWDSKGDPLIFADGSKIANICKPYLIDEEFYFCGRDQGNDYSIYTGDLLDLNLSNQHRLPKYIFESDWNKLGQAYPTLLKYGEEKFMFYSGNQFGANGLGVIKF